MEGSEEAIAADSLSERTTNTPVHHCVDLSVIEGLKENIQPNKKGRNPHHLIEALKLQEQPNNKDLSKRPSAALYIRLCLTMRVV